MTKRCFSALFSLVIFLTIPVISLRALSLSDITSGITDIFSPTIDNNEGGTSFRSLLLPFGGRAESMGNAYTGLCDDISYLNSNPAAGALQNETQLSLFHNTWIADSKLETLAYTTRLGFLPHFGLGAYASCFYVPFTEYDIFGEKAASSYYVEAITAVNASYNFFAGYDFKGMSVGANIKAGWRNVPNFTNNDVNTAVPGSGFSQSSFAIMADIGLMFQFNFLKYFASREPNVRIGLTAQNLGIAITGFGDKLELDAGLPTLFSAGMSVRFIKPFTLAIGFTQPMNLMKPQIYLLPYIELGASIQFTSFLSLLAGLQLKGSKPTLSAGLEFELTKVRVNLNYSLDFTTSLAPINRFSLSTKLQLGDRGRKKTRDEVDEIYKAGLIYYQNAEWQKAIDTWEQALKIDKRFDPAKLGIKSAQHQIDMFEEIKKSLMLD